MYDHLPFAAVDHGLREVLMHMVALLDEILEGQEMSHKHAQLKLEISLLHGKVAALEDRVAVLEFGLDEDPADEDELFEVEDPEIEDAKELFEHYEEFADERDAFVAGYLEGLHTGEQAE